MNVVNSAVNRLIGEVVQSRTGIDPTVSQREIGSVTQKSKGTGGLVSIVSYSRPSLMIIHVERPWGQRLFSIVS